MFPVILGAGLAAYTLGGLSERMADRHDLVPDAAQALVLGIVFALASGPWKGAIVARAILPLPSFLVFLSILSDRRPPMPFGAAFVMAGFYALFITASAAAIAEKRRSTTP